MRLFTPNTDFTGNYISKARYLLAWRISLVFAMLFTPLSILYFSAEFVGGIFYGLVAFLSCCGLVYMKISHKSQLVYWLFSVGCSLLTCISFLLIYSTPHYAEFIWSCAIIIFSFIGLGRKQGLIFMIVMSAAVTVHIFIFLNRGIILLRPLSITELVGTWLELMIGMAATAYLMQQYLRLQRYAESQLVRANSELENQNKLIKKKNDENDVLAKEVHHRVKNNLQIIISLLRMHSAEITSEETKKHFSDAINRIMTMSLIHEKLYKDKEMELVNIEEYVRDLSRALITNETELKNISIDVESSVPSVGLKTIIPLGLLLNELLTNSLKHAFDDINGFIRIFLTPCANGCIRLVYTDSGSWKEVEENGFGTELITVLTNQLEGSFTREKSTYTFELSNLDH